MNCLSDRRYGYNEKEDEEYDYMSQRERELDKDVLIKDLQIRCSIQMRTVLDLIGALIDNFISPDDLFSSTPSTNAITEEELKTQWTNWGNLRGL